MRSGVILLLATLLHTDLAIREGEAPAEPKRIDHTAQQELRPPGFPTASSAHSETAIREGEAPAEPQRNDHTAQQELRPPGFPTASSAHSETAIREGEAPAEPKRIDHTAQQELRPPGFPTASSAHSETAIREGEAPAEPKRDHHTAQQELRPPGLETASRQIQAILRAHCVRCHGETKRQGGLRFDTAAGALRAGDSGEIAIVPGQPDESELIRRVSSDDDSQWMPPEGPRLTAAEIAMLRAWIAAGATWPDIAATDAPQPVTVPAEMTIAPVDRQHWAFLPLRAIDPPHVRDPSWIRTPVDRFILAQLEAHQLGPTRSADARRLVRRAYFDLIGLPPTPDQVNDFIANAAHDAPAAWQALIDQLLASPHYGERWGRHWLDVARYADSNGQESDDDRPYAYPYRDFVIQAFNDNLPYNTFVRWQLAGDEEAPDDPQAVAATGFLTAGPNTVLSVPMEEEKIRNRYNELDNTLSTIGTGLLGLTLGCARCHDHKFDPIPARDYYRLMAAVHSGDRREIWLGAPEVVAAYERDHTAWKAGTLAQEPTAPPRALAFRDFDGQTKTTWLFHRGDFYDRNEPVSLGFLGVLTTDKSAEDYWHAARTGGTRTDSTYQRRALAEWITDTEHGAGALLARVFVNRVWRHHFGVGLINTVDDFGVRGERPSHPELLEWLATDFVQAGWNIKHLQRHILLSGTFQQDTTFDPQKAAVDPDNRLLWRRRPQRLEAEILRDAMLIVADQLNEQAFGPAFKPPISAEAIVARNTKDPYPANLEDTPAVRRRSVYMFHKRVVPYPLLQAFDRPDAQQSCGRRDTTTVATQALALLNDPFVRRRAIAFAHRLQATSPDDTETWITNAYQWALARQPTPAERRLAQAFITQQIERRTARSDNAADATAVEAGLADFCQTVFGLNEFIYVD